MAGLSLLLVFTLSSPFFPLSLVAHAMSIPSMPADGSMPPPSGVSPWQRCLIFAGLFVISSAFHAAETSITTLYPWKVKEFAKVIIYSFIYLFIYLFISLFIYSFIHSIY